MLFLKNLTRDERHRSLIYLEKQGLTSNKYYILTTLAVIIATFGLILNSAATVIGAMLVAPLMSPVLLSSMALVTGHIQIFKKAIDASIKGIILSIIIATFISLFIPIYELPTEVLIRSHPAILDMFIALAAGAVGMFVVVKRDSATLPGVAISVSLMPPLSVIGIGLATRNYPVASGAALLFITNLIAIITSGAAILFLFGFKPYTKNKEGVVRQGATFGIALLIILAIILTSSFIKVSQSEKIKANIKDELNRQLQALNVGTLESFIVEEDNHQLLVKAKILGERNLTPDDMNVLSNSLAYRTEQSINLKAIVIPVLEGGKILQTQEKAEIKKEKEKNPKLEDKAPLASASAKLFNENNILESSSSSKLLKKVKGAKTTANPNTKQSNPLDNPSIKLILKQLLNKEDYQQLINKTRNSQPSITPTPNPTFNSDQPISIPDEEF